MDKPITAREGFWPGFVGGAFVAAVTVLFVAIAPVANERNDAQLELQRERIRLEESRRGCVGGLKLSCTKFPSSQLYASELWACSLPGDRFTWLTFKRGGDL